VIDEEQSKIFNNLKENAENFLHFQYFIIVDKYRSFCEKMMNTLTEDSGQKVDSTGIILTHIIKIDYLTVIKDELEKIQFKIKELIDLAVKSSGSNTKLSKGYEATYLDKEFTDKSDKIKVINEYIYIYIIIPF